MGTMVTTELRRQAEDYYALCAEARDLGINVEVGADGFDTVAELADAVDRKFVERYEVYREDGHTTKLVATAETLKGAELARWTIRGEQGKQGERYTIRDSVTGKWLS